MTQIIRANPDGNRPLQGQQKQRKFEHIETHIDRLIYAASTSPFSINYTYYSNRDLITIFH